MLAPGNDKQPEQEVPVAENDDPRSSGLPSESNGQFQEPGAPLADAGPAPGQQQSTFPTTTQWAVHHEEADHQEPTLSNDEFCGAPMIEAGAADEPARDTMQRSPDSGKAGIARTDQASTTNTSLPPKEPPKSPSALQQPPCQLRCPSPAAAAIAAAEPAAHTQMATAQQYPARPTQDKERQAHKPATQMRPQQQSHSGKSASASATEGQHGGHLAKLGPQDQLLAKDVQRCNLKAKTPPPLPDDAPYPRPMNPSMEQSGQTDARSTSQAVKPVPSADPGRACKLSRLLPSASQHVTMVPSQEGNDAAKAEMPQLYKSASGTAPDQAPASKLNKYPPQVVRDPQVSQPGEALSPKQPPSVSLQAFNPVQLPAVAAIRKPSDPATASALMPHSSQGLRPLPLRKSILKPNTCTGPFKPQQQAPGGRSMPASSSPGPQPPPSPFNRAPTLSKAGGLSSGVLKQSSVDAAANVDQGAGYKRPIHSASLLLPARKRLAIPSRAGSTSKLPGGSQAAPVTKPVPRAPGPFPSSIGPSAEIQPMEALSLLGTSRIAAFATPLDPQRYGEKPTASKTVQGTSSVRSPGHEPLSPKAPGREPQAPAFAVKVPSLPDLALELPAPRSLARDFADHNKALEQVCAHMPLIMSSAYRPFLEACTCMHCVLCGSLCLLFRCTASLQPKSFNS